MECKFGAIHIESFQDSFLFTSQNFENIALAYLTRML